MMAERKASDILMSLQNAHLEVWKCNDAICVDYYGADVIEGPVLRRVFGKGGSFEAACYDYLEQIRGKTLVFCDGETRKEITVLG